MALLAELTHRCPLACPYCSNPLQLERGTDELDTETWRRILDEAARLGVLQVHFSGGEPLARRDLEHLIAHAAACGLYTNLITSGLPLSAARAGALAAAGLDHAQLSLQDTEAAGADLFGGAHNILARKTEAAAVLRAAGLPITLNAVMHRRNLHHLDAMIDTAVRFGAGRLEVAHVQYYGWALRNRAALMPTRPQIDRATEIVTAARTRLSGVLVIDYVVPDYYASRPKACMGGWGQRFLNVDPVGRVLPCHAATTIPGLQFDTVREKSLAEIWADSTAFNRFRGTDWMPEPCRSCERKEIDWAGCRCQALALTGDAAATDPACTLSPLHTEMFSIAQNEAAGDAPEFIYRRMDGE
ncbi:MAG: pyrroloquinoline quinone biosynthesis protein PqqE [Alphaproteobacteria bacterium]|nr:pyrroloquinoline quinone biosynthesis protein PqqE [Alphaproteobacteria bacterium]